MRLTEINISTIIVTAMITYAGFKGMITPFWCVASIVYIANFKIGRK